MNWYRFSVCVPSPHVPQKILVYNRSRKSPHDNIIHRFDVIDSKEYQGLLGGNNMLIFDTWWTPIAIPGEEK